MTELYKLGQYPLFAAERVEVFDFSKPVILQLPPSETIRTPYPAIVNEKNVYQFNSNFRYLGQIMAMSHLNPAHYNIYSFRGLQFGLKHSHDTIYGLKDNPDYFSKETQDFFEGHIIHDIMQNNESGLLSRDEYLRMLQLRISGITFIGFCYGSVMAEMFGNYMEHHLREHGYAKEERQSVIDCFFNTSTAAIIDYSARGCRVNAVHAVHAYDKERFELLGHAPQKNGDRMVEHKMHGRALAVTSFEEIAIRHSAEFELRDVIAKEDTAKAQPKKQELRWVTKIIEGDHDNIFFHNMARVTKGKLKTFQTNHTAGITATAIRKGAESSAESIRTNTPRNGRDIVKAIADIHLHDGALNLVERRVKEQANDFAYVKAVQKAQWARC